MNLLWSYYAVRSLVRGRGSRTFRARRGAAACSRRGGGAASATFHLIKIREVYPDAAARRHYVELQMFAAFQNLVGGHSVGIYNAGGYYINSPYVLPGNVSNGQTQRTVLIGNSGVAAATGVTPDFVIPGFEIPNQGTACWLTSTGGTPATDSGLDCVSFGETFAAAPSPSGTGAPTVPTGKSVTRRISPGCLTFLEAGDDTDVSATDFAVTDPSPRNNSTVPTELPCGTSPPRGNDPAEHEAEEAPPGPDQGPHADLPLQVSPRRTPVPLRARPQEGPLAAALPSPPRLLQPGPHTLKVTAVDAAETRSFAGAGTPSQHRPLSGIGPAWAGTAEA